jgi:hypothetical protein
MESIPQLPDLALISSVTPLQLPALLAIARHP